MKESLSILLMFQLQIISSERQQKSGLFHHNLFYLCANKIKELNANCFWQGKHNYSAWIALHNLDFSFQVQWTKILVRRIDTMSFALTSHNSTHEYLWHFAILMQVLVTKFSWAKRRVIRSLLRPNNRVQVQWTKILVRRIDVMCFSLACPNLTHEYVWHFAIFMQFLVTKFSWAKHTSSDPIFVAPN